jgi:hypothetical protein
MSTRRRQRKKHVKNLLFEKFKANNNKHKQNQPKKNGLKVLL